MSKHSRLVGIGRGGGEYVDKARTYGKVFTDRALIDRQLRGEPDQPKRNATMSEIEVIYQIETKRDADAIREATRLAREDGIEPLRAAITARERLFGFSETAWVFTVTVKGTR